MKASYHRHDINDKVWNYLSHTYWAEKEHGEEMPGIIELLLMRFSGY